MSEWLLYQNSECNTDLHEEASITLFSFHSCTGTLHLLPFFPDISAKYLIIRDLSVQRSFHYWDFQRTWYSCSTQRKCKSSKKHDCLSYRISWFWLSPDFCTRAIACGIQKLGLILSNSSIWVSSIPLRLDFIKDYPHTKDWDSAYQIVSDFGGRRVQHYLKAGLSVAVLTCFKAQVILYRCCYRLCMEYQNTFNAL